MYVPTKLMASVQFVEQVSLSDTTSRLSGHKSIE